MVQVTTPRDQKVYVNVQAGYIPTTTMFDWMFENAVKFGRYLRGTFFEANAGFKALLPVIREEEKRRKINLHMRPFPALGDKDARIRNTLQPELNQNLLFTLEAYETIVAEELASFPQSRKKDIVDCMSIGVMNRYRPPNENERESLRKEKKRWMRRTTNITGY